MSDSRPEIPSHVIKKLIFFTAAMIISPLLTFFIVQNLFGGNAIYSGGAAALVANVVLISYLVVAFTEELPKDEKPLKEKKNE